MTKKTVRDVEFRGKRVLLRCDFNVPLDDRGAISDDSRIRLSLPTIKFITERGASVVVCSHFGRPKGKVVEEDRLTPVRMRLSEMLGADVVDAGGPTGDASKVVAQSLKPGQVALLENVRFHPGEESNDPAFARSLAELADIFVNDAFAAAHRAHASVSGVAALLPSVAGLLMEKELEMLGAVLASARRPAVALVGGAKVSDKIQVLTSLAARMDVVLVGGGMTAAFLKAEGYSGGQIEVSPAEVAAAESLLSSSGPLVMTPEDVVVAAEFKADSPSKVVRSTHVPPDSLILDIGPLARRTYAREIGRASLVVWNGPMGVFEWPQFSAGTVLIAEAVAANRDAITVIGGGSTAEVVERLGMRDRYTHVSTGGGASLEFLEGKTLPGVAALDDK